MPPTLALDEFKISLNGMPMMPPMLDAIIRVVVDTNLHMPSMFEIHFSAEADLLGLTFKYIDIGQLSIGTLVKITAQAMETSDIPPKPPSMPTTLIQGEITALEPHFNDDGTAVLVVRGYDKTHRLHRGRKIKTFANMTFSAICMQVTQAAGLLARVSPTSTLYEYVLQDNITDMEFLRMLARREGMWMTVNDVGMLVVSKRGVPSGPGPVLTWNGTLKSFHPRATAATQVTNTSVFAYDPKLKQPIGTVLPVPPSTSGGPSLSMDMGFARTKFGASARFSVTDQPLSNIGAATVVATASAQAIMSDFLTADGECIGDPRVKAGRMVTIAKVGMKFSGSYLVTSATHNYDETGYMTTFHVEGSETQALMKLLGNDNEKPGRIYGVVNGIVTNNMDPMGLGRVQVKYPFLSDPLHTINSTWCRVATPMAGGIRGFYSIPEVGDEVLVAFEQGDVNFPYVIGSVWNNIDRPPKPSSAIVVGGKVNQRMFVSRSGHQIIFDDTQGREKITIMDKTLNNSIVIDSTQNQISIEVAGPCNITAKQAVNIKSVGQDVVVDCTNFKVTAKANIELTANANLQMKATGQADLEGSTETTVKGGIGSVMLGPSGADINNGALTVQ